MAPRPSLDMALRPREVSYIGRRTPLPPTTTAVSPASAPPGSQAVPALSEDHLPRGGKPLERSQASTPTPAPGGEAERGWRTIRLVSAAEEGDMQVRRRFRAGEGQGLQSRAYSKRAKSSREGRSRRGLLRVRAPAARPAAASPELPGAPPTLVCIAETPSEARECPALETSLRPRAPTSATRAQAACGAANNSGSPVFGAHARAVRATCARGGNPLRPGRGHGSSLGDLLGGHGDPGAPLASGFPTRLTG
jgi:hypothetical protein